MKKIFFCILILFVGSVVWMGSERSDTPDDPPVSGNIEPSIETTGTSKEDQVVDDPLFFSMKGKSSEETLTLLGEPDYMYPSAYGYEWWLYETEKGRYFQLGIADHEVVTGVLFHQEEGPVTVGESYNEVMEKKQFPSTLRLESEGAYSLELTEKDVKERPVISLDDKWSAQIYFDDVTEKVSAIRMIRNDYLLKMQPYKVLYRGTLPTQERLGNEEWEAVQEGVEAQILRMTNFIRNNQGLGELKHHTAASQAAFLHSRDMDENNYFSHYSPNGNGLKERLENVFYVRAGENIAAQYTDAAAALHGWLNSPGHRKALLDPDYTHIGVGVHERYYTQNFLTLP
ncbi:CAP domain-containing protein [Halobacillus sp. H74]|uniref:CAP domain-containing protein n=1 Tax=Halobacillus sp. H74 TaxID=3457436 RepID=UPI003FCC6302